jgi:PAS domain S-box-containing protein
MNAQTVTAALRHAAARHHPSLVWIAAPDGSWVDLNENWTLLTGKSIPQSLGQGWLDCLAAPVRERAKQQWQAALAAREPVSIEVSLICADGSEQAMLLKSHPVLSAQGELSGFVGCLEEKSELEAQLREARAACRRIEAALQVRDQYLAVISHELRSPLSGIQSWAYVLERTLDGNATPTLRRALAGIKTGVQQQVKLIDELMDGAQVMSGRVALQCEPLAPQSLVDQALERLQGRLEEKGIQLAREIDTAMGKVNGDRVRMVQIIENILSNAIRFSAQGGAIVVAIHAHGDEVSIGVTDYGKGIAPHRLPLLQDPYAQQEVSAGAGNTAETHSAVARPWQAAGIGLKLALTRRLLELQGGRMTLASEGEGKGAEFVVHFPLLRTA